MYRYSKKIICVMFFALILTFTVAAKNNIALNCKIDSVCGESSEEKSASMIIDDDKNYETKWETSDIENHPDLPHWVIFDLESEKSFDSVRLVKASQGLEDFGKTELNADSFKFEVSSDKINWVTIIDVSDDGDNDIFEGFCTPVSARYLKLTITQPERDAQENKNQAVRLYDLKVFETEFNPGEEYTEDENIIDIETEPVSAATLPEASDTSDYLIYWLMFLAVITACFSGKRTKRR